MKRAKIILLFIAMMMWLSGCDDTEYQYASLRAFFRFSPATAAPKTLLPALSGPGQWCCVTVDATKYIFTAMDGNTDTYPITAADQYNTRIWVSGLLVGTPSVLPVGSSDFSPVCFDLVCPNCMENDAITRGVKLGKPGNEMAECTRCGRKYDLNNLGIVSAGAVANERNVSLYRYRCSYSNNTFVVQN